MSNENKEVANMVFNTMLAACVEHLETLEQLRAEIEALRQPTQSNALRDLVAALWCASGCSCCRDDDAWEKASKELAELFGVPRYEDGSGYDWYSVRDAALQEPGK